MTTVRRQLAEHDCPVSVRCGEPFRVTLGLAPDNRSTDTLSCRLMSFNADPLAESPIKLEGPTEVVSNTGSFTFRDLVFLDVAGCTGIWIGFELVGADEEVQDLRLIFIEIA